MLTLATLLFVAPAAQQDIYVQTVSQAPSPGKVTQHARYTETFSTGWELDPQGRKQGVRYHHPSGSSLVTKLALGAFTPGGESAGLGVNVGGQVVGWAEDLVGGAALRRPFVFDDANGLQLIDLPPGAQGWATGVAIFGHSAAGTMRRADGSLQAWWVDLWPSLTPAVALATPPGWESEALVMRQDNGLAPLLIGGLVRSPAGREFAAFWGGGGPVTILPTPGTGDARLTGLSSHHSGDVSGYILDAAGHEQGFLLNLADPVNSFVSLPSLGGAWTRPTGMDNVSVYGAAEDAQGRSRAFQFFLDGHVMVDLNDRASVPPGAVLTEMTSSQFGVPMSFDLEVGGVTYGAFARQVVSNVWPLQSGAPTTLTLAEGPAQSIAAFICGVTGGAVPVPGIPGLILDIAQPLILTVGVTDSAGGFAHTLPVPAAAAGLTVLFQAVVPDHSITTGVNTVTFQ